MEAVLQQKKVKVGYTIRESLVKKLKEEAIKRNMKMSNLLENILSEYFSEKQKEAK